MDSQSSSLKKDHFHLIWTVLAERGICLQQSQPRIRVPVECRQGGGWEDQGRPSGKWGKQEVKTLAWENLGAMVVLQGP